MISHTIGPPATASHRTSTRWMLGGGIVYLWISLYALRLLRQPVAQQ